MEPPRGGDGDGVRLHVVRTGGPGPLVVAAHGITDSGACWAGLVAAMRGTTEFVVYDARGHGLSDRATSYTVRDHVDDLVRLLDDLGEPVVLLGHSMGGVTATWAAGERPDQVRGLVVEDPAWWAEPFDVATIETDVAERRRAIEADNARTTAELLDTGRRNEPRWGLGDLRPWADAKRQADPEVPTWLRSIPELDAWRDAVALVRCPVLVITGDTGVRVTDVVAKSAQQAHPDLTVARVEDAGHSVRRDQPAAYLTAFSAFLARLAA